MAIIFASVTIMNTLTLTLTELLLDFSFNQYLPVLLPEQ